MDELVFGVRWHPPIIFIIPTSVCPSVLLSPPKPLDEIQPNFVCWLLTCIGRATVLFARPLGPGEGSKGQISLNFNNKVNFIFLNQTVCVFSQIKGIKHIKRIFFMWPGS